jgi:hypothetical protein
MLTRLPTWTLTKDTPERFIQAFNALAATKNVGVDDVKHEAYFDTLGELPIDWVVEAAKQLRESPSSFMPDAGSWYSLADELAFKSWEADTASAAEEVSAPRDPAHDEEQRTREARKAFLDQMEEKGLLDAPRRAAWERRPVKIPRFGCAVCRDVGWVPTRCTAPEADRAGYWYDTYGHCACWESNPVLQERRLREAAWVRQRKSGGVSQGATTRLRRNTLP